MGNGQWAMGNGFNPLSRENLALTEKELLE